MGIVRAQVVTPMDSAVPRDSVVNAWHFTVNDPAVSNLTPVTTALRAFYTAAAPLLSGDTNLAGIIVKYYDLEQPTPRPPISEVNLGVVATTGSGVLPAELAICLSFQGVRQAGIPQGRRRGRIYVGPLSTTANTSGRLTNSMRTSLAQAGEDFLVASLAAPEYTWVVFSTVSPVGQRTTAVSDGWVDDAFDVQRRRGLAPTIRTTWPTP